ncbi:hypothetical protein A3A76_03650 [Candidatus Woesebacteria bacterium RIFCSPLOWO2_01_FULL_39_23]|uniref:Methyltransferase type 11 domain-containing protein n=1 Tax=Candidatus Woesebacteria bacterium RIFCSPHIGHO2_01_FULL_40_22 TaxID=1802499 RepID=A0A1F7YKY8_9BACT|nr:MAG: hypothetical protein A2141_00375 [Candidatus Woesebacteria bacterium RBG_16_40_11]OGM27549.1 MAG: hypothetical protein A2628_02050 [Candidatus Woesebacteria bacterium RIFCSPHIGHO2_01_FULL_40_22]OGM36141.1 MAG: hypothetical protein A3E41_02290 [Candidatus Woesebacteria bacterium RIFCSPHIGHO2_12_FULL_38_9]OGM62723.1 MAG: hypothetical protein A3A76_03650 [Candidatus Woesebacteria bacterium RIFCSPLOWO2_01_FULL_39_23]
MLSDTDLINKYKIKKSDVVVDIGGSMKQHTKINIDTLVDLIKPEEAPYSPTRLTAKNFVKCDVTRDNLPFKNKEFDFCLCTHTLEDLNHPFILLEEMSRISKRGYISTPSFGCDIVFSHINFTDWLSGARRVPGNAHHKWLFLNDNNTMVVIPKNFPLLYTSEFQAVGWKGEPELEYYWEGKIIYKEMKDVNFHKLIDLYRDFYKAHTKEIVKGRVLYFIDSPYYLLKENVKLLFKRK